MKMRKRLFLLLPAAFVVCSLRATTYYGTPSDYTSYFSLLQPGDSLLLEAGDYYDRMNLDDIVGTESAPIVISGPASGASAILYGDACCNTVSIERCAYLTISNLVLDGQDIPYIDAVKAEGTSGNWAHHITIENLLIIHHGGASLTVGISTKCPAWNWVIRHNTLIEPGVGLYLGNSDGTAPFVAGLVEYNLVLNPRRYCMQIKHQNVGTRDVAGMPTQAHTTIRYNVFSRDEGSDPDTPRPNLLVGAFPASGSGSNDYYEIYGNFLWQNPNEGLFQGTGNLAFYDNLLVNYYSNGWGVLSFPHNDFAPREVHYFHNTIYTTSYGIEMYDVDAAYEQNVTGNAIFAPIALQLDSDVNSDNNLLPDPPELIADFLQDPYSPLGQADYRPAPGYMQADPPIDLSLFTQYERYNRDFEGHQRDGGYYGAYLPSDELLWTPDLEIRPEVALLPVSVLELYPAEKFYLRVHPNPVSGDFLSLSANIPTAGVLRLSLSDINGRILLTQSEEVAPGLWEGQVALSHLPKGYYFLSWTTESSHGSVKIIRN